MIKIILFKASLGTLPSSPRDVSLFIKSIKYIFNLNVLGGGGGGEKLGMRPQN